jgi:hypothetical protein
LGPARRHVAHAPTSSAVGSGSAVAPTHTPSWMTQPLTRPAQMVSRTWRCAWTTPAVAPAQCCSGRPRQLIPTTRTSHMLDAHARVVLDGCAAPRRVTHVSRLPSGQGPLWESFVSSSAPDSTCYEWCRGALNAPALTRERCSARPQSNTHTYPSSNAYTYVRSHSQALSHGAGWLCGASPVACTRTERRVRVGCGTSSTAPDSTFAL